MRLASGINGAFTPEGIKYFSHAGTEHTIADAMRALPWGLSFNLVSSGYLFENRRYYKVATVYFSKIKLPKYVHNEEWALQLLSSIVKAYKKEIKVVGDHRLLLYCNVSIETECIIITGVVHDYVPSIETGRYFSKIVNEITKNFRADYKTGISSNSP